MTQWNRGYFDGWASAAEYLRGLAAAIREPDEQARAIVRHWLQAAQALEAAAGTERERSQAEETPRVTKEMLANLDAERRRLADGAARVMDEEDTALQGQEATPDSECGGCPGGLDCDRLRYGGTCPRCAGGQAESREPMTFTSCGRVDFELALVDGQEETPTRCQETRRQHRGTQQCLRPAGHTGMHHWGIAGVWDEDESGSDSDKGGSTP